MGRFRGTFSLQDGEKASFGGVFLKNAYEKSPCTDDSDQTKNDSQPRRRKKKKQQRRRGSARKRRYRHSKKTTGREESRGAAEN